jgi:hypothetical protein
MSIDSTTETRLLRVYPGSFDNPLVCDLEPCSLVEPPPYEALSYTWDKEDAEQPMVINGCNRPIRSNLDSALRHLRKEEAPLVIWVDAVCINQKDVSEVSHQVSRMGTVFSKAEIVRVWLGRQSHHNAGINDAFKIAHPDYPDRTGSTSRAREISDMFNRRWFQRRWVVQEVMLSKHAMVHYSHETVPWETLIRVANQLGYGYNVKYEVVARPAKAAARVFASLENISNSSRDSGKLSDIISLLVNHRELRTSDPRDFVYSFWGLANDINGIWSPDYSKTPVEVFVDIVRHSILTYKSLDIICHHWAPWQSRLPSWIPQFFPAWDRVARRGMGVRVAKAFAGMAGKTTYNASASLPVDADVLSELKDSGIIYILRSKAHNIACITCLESLDVWEYYEYTETEWPRGNQIHTKVPEEHFLRLIIGGRTPANEVPSEQYLTTEIRKITCKLTTCNWLAFHNEANVLRTLECMSHRHLALTSNGLISLVPLETKTDDLVYILPGCSVPVIPRQSGEHFKVIGEAYVQGIMEGELCQDRETFAAQFETITMI